MIRRLQHIVSVFIVVIICSCSNNEQKEPVAAKPENKLVHTYTEKGSVKEIVIQPENPQFPDHEGKMEFMSYCAICHSLKYISAQPDFPRKTWEAEVHKMVEKYGAPIDSVTAHKIVEYLVAIKSGTTAGK